MGHAYDWEWAIVKWELVIKFGADGHGLEANYNSLRKWYRARDWVWNGKDFPLTDWGKADSSPNTFEAGKAISSDLSSMCLALQFTEWICGS